MRAIVQFCREESNLSSISHFILDGTLPVCECVLYMHAQTCARAQMYDVVVACIRGMKGKRLFNTDSGCLSKGGYCLSVAGFTEYLSVCWLCGTYSYLASHATRGNGHQGLRSIPVSHFFFSLSCMTVMNPLSASELSTSLAGSK